MAERSQYGFTKEKCSINLVVFDNEATGLVDEGSIVDVVYVDFKTAFHISCKTMSQWTVR